MKAEARRRGVDLLLVDAGDRVDGNGLVDAEPSPHPKGYTALDIFSRVPYDVVTTVRAHSLSCLTRSPRADPVSLPFSSSSTSHSRAQGNHELYKFPVASYVSTVMHDKFGDRWVVSNVNITTQDDVSGREVERLLGNRMRRFETEQGREVVAFGPLFDFKGASRPLNEPSKPSRTAVRLTRSLMLPPRLQLMRRVSPSRRRRSWSRSPGSARRSLPHPTSSCSVRRSSSVPSRTDRSPTLPPLGALTLRTLLLTVGHMSLRTEPDSEWSSVVRAIREVHPTVPVLVFGGHHHVRLLSLFRSLAYLALETDC